ncbi:putative peptidoglycan lipid II flippase [Mycolicibacterium iranicum]|uniref:Putative peptidoglycan lipid II flippase n=1 Tax=Mycolicibacterium iranicum TaxID=912594 RepID=A0A839QDK9_MYCIR|nr:protein kinase family protein [Mycolicibacterium iranicum]MBB2992854.1 putative peptidoglycan lipid II flippase [Mycolicibacterium iranicum]
MTMTDPVGDDTAPLPRIHERATQVLPTAPAAAGIGAGARLAGRFRLIAVQDVSGALQFWQGHDLASGRPVGVTLIPPGPATSVGAIRDILDRARRLSALEMSGLAPLVDTFTVGDVGVVVSEWVPGGTLREVADTAPSPTASAAALKSLVVTADAAHRAGLVLGIDHPGRVRISSDGRAVLAFPAPLAQTTSADDLRGLGGVLYALLLNRWPPQDPMPDGWVPADLDEAGWAREPAAITPGIPFLISSAAAGLLRADGGVESTSTLLALLKHAGPTPEHPTPAEHRPPPTTPAPARRGGYAVFRTRDDAGERKRARRQLTYTVLGVAAAVMLVALTGLGSTVNRVLDAHDDTVAMDPAQLGLSPDPATTAPAPPKVLKQGAVDPAVVPVAAAVFSPDGSPDNPETARNVIDGDPATVWSTDRYYDANPFPAFKQGLGVLLVLPEPTKVGAVSVETRSSGTTVQIRSAATAEPKTLADTTELGPPVPLQPGPNRIPLGAAAQTSTVLVWITGLGDTAGAHRAEIAEIAVNAPAIA